MGVCLGITYGCLILAGMIEYGPITNGPRSWGGVLTEIERKLLCILTEYAKLNLPTHIDIDLHADLRTWKGKEFYAACM